jgi:hypothetical protein
VELFVSVYSVQAEQKTGLGRKIERRKMSVVSFCVRFFCHTIGITTSWRNEMQQD